MFRLAHVTDPHFRGFAGLGPEAFVGKRAVGHLNLAENRSRHHKMRLLEELRLDLRAVLRKCREDWDLADPGLKIDWDRGDKERFYQYARMRLQAPADRNK